MIEKSAIVDAPADRIFAILEEPERIPEFAPGVERVEDVRRSERRIGDSYRTVYSVLGRDFPMTFTVRQYEPQRKIVAEMAGGMTGTVSWTLEPQGDATRVDLRFDYQMRGGILGKAMDALVVERRNEQNSAQMLENLKRLSEGGAASRQG